MPIEIRGEAHYQTSQACQTTGVSTSSLPSWVRQGILKDTTHKDIRGWRLFTEDDLEGVEQTLKHATEMWRCDV